MILIFLDEASLIAGFGISASSVPNGLTRRPPYLGLLSFVASEKSELKLFLDEMDGINLCCCLLGEVPSSRTFRDPGADLRRRLNDNMVTKEN